MKRRSWPWLGIVGLAVIWRAIYAYWTPLVNRYLVPPGDDPAYHLAQIDRILHGHWALVQDSYPMGFHLLSAGIARLLGMDSLAAIRLIPPALLVVPVVVLFFVGWRLFNSLPAGAVAAAAWAFLALAPIRSFGDGNYPDLLADSVFLPWAMMALYQFCRQRTPGRFAGLVIPAGLILLTHHLTFVQFLLVSLPSVIWAVRSRLREPAARRRTLRNWLVGLALLAGLALVAWPAYGPTLVQPYWEALLSQGSLAKILSPYSTPPTLLTFLQIHNPVFVGLALAGLVAVLVSRQSRELKILLAGWVGVLILLTLTPFFGLPGRFLRELAVPFALLIGYLPVVLFQSLSSRAARVTLVVVVVAIFAGDWLVSFRQPYALPDPFGPLIRVQHDEEPGLAVLDKITPATGTILANNADPYLGYLVHRKVVIVNNPTDAEQIIMLQPIVTVYVAARPPLTPAAVYPYFRNFDATAAALKSIPGLIPAEVLGSGTRIYRYPTPKPSE